MRRVFLSFLFDLKSFIYKVREDLVGVGFDLSSRLYILFKTGPVWSIHATELLSYPEDSLGYHLGYFLLNNKFDLQPHCEDHDIFHILTGYSTDTAQEIAMQYWLWGNGKRSIYSALAMFVGVVFYPDKYRLFLDSHRQGNLYIAIHSIDYQKRLLSPIIDFGPRFK